jgi:hypothetical protein
MWGNYSTIPDSGCELPNFGPLPVWPLPLGRQLGTSGGRAGIEVDHVSIYRWVQRFTPLLLVRRME